MRKRPIFFLLTLTISILFYSCDNTLDILDEYKDTPIVYGLLNKNDTLHYVRIQKGFLGEGNALLMAQYPDSIYYDTASISVHIYSTINGSPNDTIVLYPSFDKTKVEGLFTDEKHRLYQLYLQDRSTGSLILKPFFKLKTDNKYQLEIKNKITGTTTVASTDLVESISQQSLFPSSKVNLASDYPFNVRIGSAKNGKVYGLIMRFKYKEFKPGAVVGTDKFIDYYLDNMLSTNTNGGQSLIFLIDGASFFSYLKQHLPKDPTVTRPIGYVAADFIFTVGTSDLYNYIQVNSPGNTVNYIPEYTNLSNGKGVFTSRWSSTVSNMKFNTPTLDSLLYSHYTTGLFN
ncbi:MAG: hypothetical protein ACKOX3_06580 [Bacteroidota bacterium]